MYPHRQPHRQSKNQLQSMLHKCLSNLNISRTNVLNTRIQNIIQGELCVADKLRQIYTVIQPYTRKLSADRQVYICDKINTYLSSQDGKSLLPISNNTRILDIGGGIGNILSFLGKTYEIPKENLVCLENKSNFETGAFYREEDLHQNISYTFWETLSEQQKTDFVGKFDIIICMVSIHHMTTKFIHNILFPSIKQWSTSDAKLLVKEHDVDSTDTELAVNWEHHMYHLFETPQLDAETYLHSSIFNYTSANELQTMIRTELNGMCIRTFNNKFEVEHTSFSNITPTKLYWNLYDLGPRPQCPP
jgi:2-polyprenyl-3-methyl-5-hydroxy-6-metoxy-1,4-benzoquinol methylase